MSSETRPFVKSQSANTSLQQLLATHPAFSKMLGTMSLPGLKVFQGLYLALLTTHTLLPASYQAFSIIWAPSLIFRFAVRSPLRVVCKLIYSQAIP
jgi:hypothetical protein